LGEEGGGKKEGGKKSDFDVPATLFIPHPQTSQPKKEKDLVLRSPTFSVMQPKRYGIRGGGGKKKKKRRRGGRGKGENIEHLLPTLFIRRSH